MTWFQDGESRIYFEDTSGGDAVLLLPGLTDSIKTHQPLRQALVDAGFRVIAADLPGSGRSQPQPRVYTTNYYAEDARSFVALLAHLEVTSAHLVGFSDGGEVALLMAELYPEAIQSVVTWGSAGQINDPSGQLVSTFYNIIDNPIPPLRGFSQHLIAAYGEDVARATTQSAARAMTQIIEQRGGDLSLAKAATIACPVMLIAGEDDQMAPPGLVAVLASRIPDARLVEAIGAGHDIHHSHTAWLVTTVLGWLHERSRAE